jgi:hypothetical protein
MKSIEEASHSNHKIPWDELAAPAQRALAGAGYANLEDLAKVNESQIKWLHGIGPGALETLKKALHALGMDFAKND